MVNEKHKDRLFRFIFGREENKKWTLSLYNAINGTAYEDASQLELNTIEDALYMSMKNDLSFLLDWNLNIYEQQSTYNPNMPLRAIVYLGALWSKLIQGNKAIYGRRIVKLPVPRFLVFYNGKEKREEEEILYLSDAFPEELRSKADIELQVHMLNVNWEHNRELLQKCEPLKEYSWLIEKIREFSRKMETEKAVDRVLEEMPEEFEIKKFLLKNRAEVSMSILTEYDEEKVMSYLREEAWQDGLEEGRQEGRQEGLEEGRQQGIQEGIEQGQKALNTLIAWLGQQGRMEDILRLTKDPEYLEQLFKEMQEEKK